jgi:hypothetical protein
MILIIVQITPHIHFVFAGILYDELKEMKAAPSQQTSLTELWKKKKGEGKTKAQPTETSSMKGGQIPVATTPIDLKVMDLDARSSLSPESSRARKPMFHSGWKVVLTDTRIYAASPNPERPAKRKASSPMSADEGGFATLSAVSYG